MMGQHHFNPTAIAAKEGRLPPKPKKMGKRETEALIQKKVLQIMTERAFGIKGGAKE